MTTPMPPKGNPIMYTSTVALHKLTYKKPHWKREKYDKMTGDA